ncbi:MAG: NACHT domain-containing protein [Anaerolineales bacterium]|nr:NACHT domain-containing protein [Anaerolineales bacterium]
MTGHRQYKITDFRLGQMILGLREKINLTQKEVADALAVSRRTIQHWEAGTAFPDSTHLKNLIAYFLTQGSFTKGHEYDEAIALWAQADESASRRKSIFDENWFRDLLQIAETQSLDLSAATQDGSTSLQRIDWGDAPDIIDVYGREKELANLTEWVIDDQCRLVTIVGMGGIGKTTLVVKFAQDVSKEFDYVIWRSLRNAPLLPNLLLECFQILSPVHASKPSIQLLLELLQQHRCLLILDNVETLHRAGNLSGIYKEGYEDYQQMFQKIAQNRHKSCLILTSRESPKELDGFEGGKSPLREMRISGLSSVASQSLLSDKGLFGSSDFWDVFVHYYTGNPLALKIASTTVRDLFGGDLAAFLREAPVTLHTLNQLLGNQIEQLSAMEKEILFWLAIERDPVRLDTLRRNFLLDIPNAEILSALLSLRQRSLIERGDEGAVFFLLPVLLEYVTDRLVSTVVEQMIKRQVEAITKHALVKSQSLDHIRDGQVRMILQPILSNLKRHFGSHVMLSEHLRQLVIHVKQLPREAQGYAGGNLLNLAIQLKTNIRGDDFSGLALRQVYLQGVEAQDANFSSSEFIDSRFTEPLETISAMAMSPSGTYLAASTYDGHIRCWNVADGKPVWTVANASRAWSLAFSQDETQLACSHFRGRVSLWDIQTGRHIHTFEGHQNWVHSVAFHPGGQFLASGGADSQICIWNIKEKALRFTLKGHATRVWSVAFSPDGALLISGGDEENLHVWDIQNGQLVRVLRHSAPGTMNVAFHPSGKWVAACCEQDPRINIWDVQTGELVETITSRSNGPTSLAFDSEGSYLVNGGHDGSVEIWQMVAEHQLQYEKRLMGHQNHIGFLAFSRNDLLATLSHGENIKIWNVESGKLIRVVEGYSRLIGANAFSPDSRLLFQGDASGKIRIWDLQSHRYIAKFQGHAGPVWTIAFSPDGKTFATAGDDRFLRLWDAASLHCIRTYLGHTGQIWSLTFSQDGSHLATGGSPHGIIIWDLSLDAGAAKAHTFGTSSDVWSLAFDPSGMNLVSGHTNGMVTIWDVKSGEIKGRMQHGTVPVGAIRFNSDGKTIITSSNEHLLKFWNAETTELIQTVSISVDGNRTRAAAIGAGGNVTATGSAESTIYLWNTSSPDAPTNPIQIEGHTSRVWGFALSQDECFLASSDEEGTTLITDVKLGKVAEKILIDRPYERMQIRGVSGLNAAERAALKALGAFEIEPKDSD